ncbi:MAG: DsrE family protein [Thermodesulfobacteriota bacterium]
MAKRILSIVETAYRATLEEQDDTVLWLAHAMRDAGAELTVLLRGNAVAYAARGQDASGLAIGDRPQRSQPRIDVDLETLAAKGVPVLAVEEDLAERGVERSELVRGVELVARASLARLAAAHDQVWHW